MKKFLSWVGAGLLCAGLSFNLHAAGVTDLMDLCTGQNQSNCPFKVDASGNVTCGSVTASGGQAGTSETLSGFQIFKPTNVTSVSTSTVISVSSTYETLLSTGGNLIVGTTPSISTSTVTDGTFLILSSTSTGNGTITLQDNGTLAGSGLHLGASTRAVANDKTITLIYNKSMQMWTETSYANNN